MRQGFKLKFVLVPTSDILFLHTLYYILCLCAIILLQLSVFRALNLSIFDKCVAARVPFKLCIAVADPAAERAGGGAAISLPLTC